MRLLFIATVLLLTASSMAQMPLTGNYLAPLQMQSMTSHFNDSIPPKKWFVTKQVGLSTSFNFVNGGNATVFAVPVRVQINRRLSNNWYAFAGVAAAPAYISLNPSFNSSNFNKPFISNGMLKSNRLDLYSRAELGLMYTNDQKTFSISGSIGIERSNYPMLPFYQAGTARPAAFIAPKN